MRIDLISAVPQILESPISHSIVKRAREKDLVEIVIHNLHNYGEGKYRQIDDKPFGGGSGMVLKPEPIFRCVEKLKSERSYDAVIITSAKGKLFDQSMAKKFSLFENLIFICGHYKGIDQRVTELTGAEEISIGRFVLSGGELPALAIVDAIVRLIPGALGDGESALTDTFIDEDYIEPPIYTRPREFEGLKVPQILLEGDHSKIKDWKDKISSES
ncbi:MAG: tRNA (guanosine(37)-N1)-methyltransferase TrmD [Ignavibacteria bacterium]|nr:tRNA (guanosine(37)-N1)-methyltransferase TrmD [Ignavibacteria bacterium]